MKIGFSSLVSPGWDLASVIGNAVKMGFDGVELRGLRGELNLPLVPELAADPEQVREMLAEHKIELVCLGASATLDSRKSKEVAKQKAKIIEFIELASRLGCPLVRLFAGEVQRRDTQDAALSRIASGLASLAPAASQHQVTIVVENGGDFLGSQDLWFLVDAVAHPAVRCCWNQCHAKAVGERPTNSIPRLGHRIGLVHVCDAKFDAQGVLLEYKGLGQGDAEVSTQIDLLKGVAYDRYLIFEWPKLWMESLPEPEAVLPESAKFLRERINAKQPVLSAYKGDKNAPRIVVRKTAGAR